MRKLPSMSAEKFRNVQNVGTHQRARFFEQAPPAGNGNSDDSGGLLWSGLSVLVLSGPAGGEARVNGDFVLEVMNVAAREWFQ